MPLEQIQSVILGVLEEIQRMSGRPWNGISLDAKPLFVVEGFDSLCSVEASMLIEEKLQKGRLKADSFFVSEKASKPISVRQSSRLIQKLIKESVEDRK